MARAWVQERRLGAAIMREPCSPTDAPRILHWHLRKTGGTDVRNTMQEAQESLARAPWELSLDRRDQPKCGMFLDVMVRYKLTDGSAKRQS